MLRGYSQSREAEYAKAITTAEAALKRANGIRPTTIRERVELALMQEQSHTLIGDSTWYGGNPPGALVHYERGKAVVDATGLGSDVRILKRQGFTTYTVASSLFSLGEPQKAVAMSESGLAAIARLRLFDDSASARRIENIVREEYSYELQNTGRIAEAYSKMTSPSQATARMRDFSQTIIRSCAHSLQHCGHQAKCTAIPEIPPKDAHYSVKLTRYGLVSPKLTALASSMRKMM